MGITHEFEICRALYQCAREKGAPVVHITDLGHGHICGETADGKILSESIDSCCKWSMKWELAHKWLNANAPTHAHQ